MKKILGSLLVIGALSINLVNASFMMVDIDPVCSITGDTYTVSAAGKSDTSSWAIPNAYSGECKKTVELSSKTKEKIYKISSKFFMQFEKDNTYATDGITLNSQGRMVVKNKLFPAIQKLLQKK
ncbi:MAG: hypothetical protein Q9M97_09635 [Candidatus Gracilibacteria bacterium]|nr:hypothetical protein [Candidatus Gracilibacteria bacterium]